MTMFDEVPADMALIDNLTYLAYEHNRNLGMTHEALADILPLGVGMADKYKMIYELMNGDKK